MEVTCFLSTSAAGSSVSALSVLVQPSPSKTADYRSSTKNRVILFSNKSTCSNEISRIKAIINRSLTAHQKCECSRFVGNHILCPPAQLAPPGGNLLQ